MTNRKKPAELREPKQETLTRITVLKNGIGKRSFTLVDGPIPKVGDELTIQGTGEGSGWIVVSSKPSEGFSITFPPAKTKRDTQRKKGKG